MSKPEHPDYVCAPAERRWTGGALPALWRVLQQELASSSGRRVWRVLPGGAFVVLERTSNGRTLRIQRTQKPRRANGAAAFAREVDTFAKAFGVQSWTREAVPDAPGIGMVLTEVQHA